MLTPPLLQDTRARLVLMALNAWTNTQRPLARRDGYVQHQELVPSAQQAASVLMLLPRIRAQQGLSQMQEPPPAILAQQELLAVEQQHEVGPQLLCALLDGAEGALGQVLVQRQLTARMYRRQMLQQLPNVLLASSPQRLVRTCAILRRQQNKLEPLQGQQAQAS